MSAAIGLCRRRNHRLRPRGGDPACGETAACRPPSAGEPKSLQTSFRRVVERKTEAETFVFAMISRIDQLITGRQLRSKAPPRFHVSIDVNITAQVSFSKRCTAELQLTPPTSATPALRHRSAAPITRCRTGSFLTGPIMYNMKSRGLRRTAMESSVIITRQMVLRIERRYKNKSSHSQSQYVKSIKRGDSRAMNAISRSF